MVFLNVGKLRAIFDSLATDIEAVVTEKTQFEEEVSRLRHELLDAQGQLGAFRHLNDVRRLMAENGRQAKKLLEAGKSIKELRKNAKALSRTRKTS